jgi:hypothetical protein
MRRGRSGRAMGVWLVAIVAGVVRVEDAATPPPPRVVGAVEAELVARLADVGGWHVLGGVGQ